MNTVCLSRWLVIFSVLAFVPMLPAADLHVATTAGASDLNPGIAELPFATINHAALVAQPGDTVWIGPGTHQPTAPITPARSGTAEAPIIYRSVTPGPSASLAAVDLGAFEWTAFTDPDAYTDRDGDGVVNVLEYALGGKPLTLTSPPPPQAQLSDHTLEITFHRARADLTYLVEATSDLAAPIWQIIATNPGTVGQPVTVLDPETLPPAPAPFLRLRVTAP